MLSELDNWPTFWPSTEMPPLVGSSSPAMTDSKVVLPHPLGPTSSVISPNCTSKSTPRSSSARLSPVPNSFFTCRQETALVEISAIACLIGIALTSKYYGWFQHQHAANAHQARQNHDQEHRCSGARSDLPEQGKAAK